MRHHITSTMLWTPHITPILITRPAMYMLILWSKSSNNILWSSWIKHEPPYTVDSLIRKNQSRDNIDNKLDLFIFHSTREEPCAAGSTYKLHPSILTSLSVIIRRQDGPRTLEKVQAGDDIKTVRIIDTVDHHWLCQAWCTPTRLFGSTFISSF